MKKIILAAVLSLFTAAAFGQAKNKQVDTTGNNTVTRTAFKMHFDDLFHRNADNTISPIRMLMVNGEMVNTDTKIAAGVKYGGIEIAAFTGHDALVDTQKSVVIIRRFLK